MALKRKLAELLNCSICLCVMTDPRKTSCHHYFCKGCIAGWRRGTCPVCRGPKRMSKVDPLLAQVCQLVVEELEEEAQPDPPPEPEVIDMTGDDVDNGASDQVMVQFWNHRFQMREAIV